MSRETTCPQTPLVGHRVQIHSAKSSPESLTKLSSQLLSISLALLAVSTYSIVVADGAQGVGFWARLTLQTLVILGGASLARLYAPQQSTLTPIISPLLVLLAFGALGWEWISRSLLGNGLPFEMITMAVVRNVVIGLSIFSLWPSMQRLCVVMSLFLTMFGAIAGHDLLVEIFATTFAIGAVIWLVVTHWENVQKRLHGRENSIRPQTAWLIPFILFLAIITVFAARGRAMTSGLSGILPSSGGSGQQDPFARRGVGDGEMLVAGTDQVQSFAPIENAPFVPDDRPSLYDVFDDTYMEDMKIAEKDRAIALPPEFASRLQRHLHAQTEKAHREFSTLRKARDPSQKHKVEDIRSDALFFVAGRVPLHLRLQVYDLFDGTTWYPEETPEYRHPLAIKHSQGRPWLELQDRGFVRGYLGAAETHALKIVGLGTNVIPAPLYLHGVHIDQVDRLDMFQHGPDGLVALDLKELPALVPIHIASRAVKQSRLREFDKLLPRGSDGRADVVIPSNIDTNALATLARKWSAGKTEGWDQIFAVVEKLRSEYEHDPDWRPEETTSTTVEEFLYRSRRGPDYQFATAAALLLRSLGYSTRVVSGFYADPEQYDSQSQHTPVLPDDVHFWVELRMMGGDWITIEPTPGYLVLQPPPALLERIWMAGVSLVGLVTRNWMLNLALTLAGLSAWWRRRALIDAWVTLAWRIRLQRWRSRRALDQIVIGTLSLLRKRAALAGMAPPSAMTQARWLTTLIHRAEDPTVERCLATLRELGDRVQYGRSDSLNTGAERVDACCRDCVRACHRQWFKAIASRSNSGNPPAEETRSVHEDQQRPRSIGGNASGADQVMGNDLKFERDSAAKRGQAQHVAF